jgi:hypothetical protein
MLRAGRGQGSSGSGVSGGAAASRTSSLASARGGNLEGARTGRLKVADEKPAAPSTECFTVSMVSMVSDTAGEVKVGPGLLTSGVAGGIDYNGPYGPVPEELCKSIDISSSGTISVVDGDFIWAKVLYDTVGGYEASEDDPVTIGGDNYTVTTSFTANYMGPTDIDLDDYRAQAGPPDPASGPFYFGWHKIAKISIADGVMTIDQIQRAAIAPPIWLVPHTPHFVIEPEA